MSDAVGAALRIIDDTNARLHGLFRAAPLNQQPVLPDLSEETVRERAVYARDLQTRIAALDIDTLPHELALTVRIARWHADRWVREADWYWICFDPAGAFYGLFAPTPYCGAYALSSILNAMARFTFSSAGDPDRYLALVADVGRFVRQLHARTEGQAARSIYMPRAAFEQAVPLLDGLATRATDALRVSADRLGVFATAAFAHDLESRLNEHVAPAFDAFRALLGPSYAAHAGEAVGMSQFPGGREIYGELIRYHTTLEMSAQEVHDLGLERMVQIREEIARLEPSSERNAPSWRRNDAAGIAELFEGYMRRIEPQMPRYFSKMPQAPYGAAPLPDALAASMTFGYYEMPSPERPRGTYLFNARNLTQRSLVDTAALIYHELIPGHHMHIASQVENNALPLLRQNSYFNAFSEGWAEYAATLAGEMGMYQTPAERFGRLMNDAFLTSRLVVDTGMNALGWSLERARAYMREHTFISDAEIASDTVRYSCDIPAQGLAYKIGEPAFMGMRERMRRALGDAFDIRAFHDAVLGPGALPFPLVEENVNRAIATATRSTTR